MFPGKWKCLPTNLKKKQAFKQASTNPALLFAGMCIMLRFIKFKVTASLLLNCTNRIAHPYNMLDRVFQLKLIYKPAVNDEIMCTVHDPEFSLRICYLNYKLELRASASRNCINYTDVIVTCKDRGMLWLGEAG